MGTSFFDLSDYFVDQKVNFFKFEKSYQIFNQKGENIGVVKQKMSAGSKALSLLVNKSILPFELEIRDSNDVLSASLSRGATLMMSKITVKDSNGDIVGTVEQKFKLFKPTFKIFNASQVLIAEITGDWKAWNFIINDPLKNQIGAISKKWAGAMKEVFTTADKYNVHINPDYSNVENKMAILSAAITIDMVLHES